MRPKSLCLATPLAFHAPDGGAPYIIIMVSDILLKLDALDYIFVAESLEISSTTFTQCAPNATDFAEMTKITAITPFKVIQGHRFWYQSKAYIVPLEQERTKSKFCQN